MPGRWQRAAVVRPTELTAASPIGPASRRDRVNRRRASSIASGNLSDEIHRQQNIFFDGQGGQELKELEDDADIPAPPDSHLIFAKPIQVCAGCVNFAGSGAIDARDEIQQSRFPAPRFPEHRDEISGSDSQRHSPQRRERLSASHRK
jgi:hypothetical protein